MCVCVFLGTCWKKQTAVKSRTDKRNCQAFWNVVYSLGHVHFLPVVITPSTELLMFPGMLATLSTFFMQTANSISMDSVCRWSLSASIWNGWRSWVCHWLFHGIDLRKCILHALWHSLHCRSWGFDRILDLFGDAGHSVHLQERSYRLIMINID